MLKISPYLNLDGTAGEAIAFYERVLGAQVIFSQTFRDMPANPDYPVPEEAKERILHALIAIGDSQLMFSDTFPGQSVTSGNLINLCISSDSVAKTKEIFEALADGGQVVMPLEETFFSPCYGSVADKFGVNFLLFTEAQS